MLSVLNITAPLFVLIGFGYVAVRTKMFPAEMLPGLGRFVIYFCIPGVVLSNLLRDSTETLFEIDFFLAYGAATLGTLATLILFNRFVMKRPLTESSVFGLGSISNSMFIGFPILLIVMPEVAVKTLMLCVLVENFLILPTSLFLIEWSRARGESSGLEILKTIAKRIVLNPIIVSIFTGLVLSNLGFSSPEFLQTAFEMLAKAAVAVALVVIGGSLVGNSIKGDLGIITSVATGKLILHPMLMFLTAGFWLADQPELALGGLIIASAPMMSIFPILAGTYGLGKTAASIILLTTLTSFITINFVLATQL